MKKQKGQTMTEYVLIIGIVVVIIIAAFAIFGKEIKGALGISGGKIVAEAGGVGVPGK